MCSRLISWVACRRNSSTWAATPRNLPLSWQSIWKRNALKRRPPRGNRGLAAALRAFREEWRFRAATEPGVFFWESSGNLDWVVIHDPNPGLVATPLHGTIFIKAMPSDLELALSPMRRQISTIGLSPVNQEFAGLGDSIGRPADLRNRPDAVSASHLAP